MKTSKKLEKSRNARISDWENMPSMGGSGGNSKTVRRADGKAAEFHKPGSQNRKKGCRGTKLGRH